MILHPASHVDHVPAAVLDQVLARYGERLDPFFIATFELPEGLVVDCGLHGPVVGDPPVAEEDVWYAARPGRPHPSRLVARPTRPTRTLTVIGGRYEEHPCVLYTRFGGPATPREVADPTLPAAERDASITFWADHALAAPAPPPEEETPP